MGWHPVTDDSPHALVLKALRHPFHHFTTRLQLVHAPVQVCQGAVCKVGVSVGLMIGFVRPRCARVNSTVSFSVAPRARDMQSVHTSPSPLISISQHHHPHLHYHQVTATIAIAITCTCMARSALLCLSNSSTRWLICWMVGLLVGWFVGYPGLDIC